MPWVLSRTMALNSCSQERTTTIPQPRTDKTPSLMYNSIPDNGNRLQCDLDATTNCYANDASGNTGSTNLGNLPTGYQLIPGLLQAYKSSAADLGGYTPPTALAHGPLPLLGGLSALGWARRLRRRLRR